MVEIPESLKSGNLTMEYAKTLADPDHIHIGDKSN